MIKINEFFEFTVGDPVAVNVNPLLELSINLLDWQVNRLVPEIAVNGAVGGVKLAVYTAVPITMRRLEI